MKNKKLFLLSVTSLLMFSIVGCGGNQNNSSDDQTNNSTSEPEPEKEMVDLSEYTINITDAKNIGIRHKNEKPKKKMLNANNLDAQEEINTLVKTTTEYKEGTTEVVEQDINVTFTKIDTTVTTKTVDGTKNYISYGATQNEDGTYKDDAKISIPTLEGYDYTVYDEANPEVIIYDKVVDDSEADLDKNPGVLELSGLKHNYSYTVKYHGVGEETTITESEIGAEIDKVYVYNSNITFLSYVPIGESYRPVTERLKASLDGQSTYDSKDYYSNHWRQSFVCDNKTGNIYKLDKDNHGNEIYIDEIKYGLLYLKDTNVPSILNINDETGILTIDTPLTNTTVPFNYAFRDKFGHTYICNDEFNDYDKVKDVYYFTLDVDFVGWDTDKVKGHYYYMLCKDGRTIKFPNIAFNNEIIGQNGVNLFDNTIEITDETGNFRQILPTDEADILKPEKFNPSYHYIFKLKNLTFYSYKYKDENGYQGWMWPQFYNSLSLDLTTNRIKSNLSLEWSQMHSYNSRWIQYLWVDYANNDVFFELTDTGKVYAYNNWFGSNLTVLPELISPRDSKIQVDDDGNLLKKGYSGNQYYNIYVEKENGIYKGKLAPSGSTYTDDGNIYVYEFSPINR